MTVTVTNSEDEPDSCSGSWYHLEEISDKWNSEKTYHCYCFTPVYI